MMKRFFFFSVIVFLFLFMGCSFFKDKSYEMEKTAEQLVEEGSAHFVNEKYKKALDAFKDLRDWYPFSKYAILAELKIADAYYELEEYEEAIYAYREFEKLHPKNEAIPHVINRRALCWYDRIDTIDRDTEPAQKALVQFKRLKENYPETSLAVKAAEKIEKCIENLAGHELYVADFYFKAGHYKSALGRYQYLIENYPESAAAEEAVKKKERTEALARKKSG